MSRNDPTVFVCDCVLSGLTSLYLGFAYLVVEYRVPYFPVCPFLLVTGTPCPLCGSTRMIGAYLHGTLPAGWSEVAFVLWFAFVVWVAAVSVARVVARMLARPSPMQSDV